jgi:hypothetical protein
MGAAMTEATRARRESVNFMVNDTRIVVDG